MNDVINVFLSSIIVTGVQFFAASKIMATQLMVKKNDVYAVYFLLTLITTILFLLTDNFWRVLIIAIILTFLQFEKNRRVAEPADPPRAPHAS